MNKLAENITQENGKILFESEGEIIRGLQVNFLNSFPYQSFEYIFFPSLIKH